MVRAGSSGPHSAPDLDRFRMLKKLASKKNTKETAVTFTVTVHALEPWTRGATAVGEDPRQIAIGWERGSGKQRGTTRVRPEEAREDGASARYAFDEAFEVDCTMQKRGGGEKGCRAKILRFFILALPEGARRGSNVETTTVGAGEIDLARFVDAGVNGYTESVNVEASEMVTRRVGTPRLTVTVRARPTGTPAPTVDPATTVGSAPDPTPTATPSDGYQWAASRFQERSEPAQETQESDQVAALTSMASMFKKRATTQDENANVDVGAAPTPDVSATEAVVEDDAEVQAARHELFATRSTPPTSPAEGEVDSDGFLLDSDLDTDDDDKGVPGADEFMPPQSIEHRVSAVATVGVVTASEQEQEEYEMERPRLEEERLAQIEAERVAAEEQARRVEEEALAQARLEEEQRRVAEEQAMQAMQAQIEAERVQAEEEARRVAEEQETRARLEEEQRRVAEEQAMQAQIEAERVQAEEEARRVAEEQETRARLEEEQRRVAEEQAMQAQIEAERVQAEEEARRFAEEQFAQEEEARREAALRLEEEQHWAAEAERERARIEEEERVRAFEEEKRRIAEEEAVAAAQAQEELQRRALEEERLRVQVEETRLYTQQGGTSAVDVYVETEISEEAASMYFTEHSPDMTTPLHHQDVFYTPAAGARFADSVMKPARDDTLESELISLSLSDVLIHGYAEDAKFQMALGLQERITAARTSGCSNAAQLEFNRVMDAFGVAIKGASSNPHRLVFLCAQIVACRVCLATMDDLDTRDILQLEVIARDAALDALWQSTFGGLLSSSKGTWNLLNVAGSCRGDGDRIGRAWVAMFQFAKAKLGVDSVANTAETGSSAKPLLTHLQNGILIDLLLKFDSQVLEMMLSPSDDPERNAMLPGGGALTFSAGAELKRAISALSAAAVSTGLGTSVDALIPKLRATADVCMIPKDALVDAKLRADIVCHKLSTKTLAAIVTKFRPDDFAPQPVDPSVIESIVSSLNDKTTVVDEAVAQAYAPAVTEGAMWISNLARALASVEQQIVRVSHLPGRSAHATRWALVESALLRDR